MMIKCQLGSAPAPATLMRMSGMDNGMIIKVDLKWIKSLIICVVMISVMIPSGHMTPIVLSILERGPPLLLS